MLQKNNRYLVIIILLLLAWVVIEYLDSTGYSVVLSSLLLVVAALELVLSITEAPRNKKKVKR